MLKSFISHPPFLHIVFPLHIGWLLDVLISRASCNTVHNCFGQFLRAFELARRTSSLPAAAIRRISCSAFSMAATSNCRLLKTSGISDAEVMCSNWYCVAGPLSVCLAM
ncbi:hypothetical protein F5J12DRAFT_293472 [Pisolithus orientalis]|uniref:uncharacterized protein n=1 Tax=Pisolithus orientalis TaxID=936130 RepID=UPI002224AAA3|nr:uncharacterized protein F5J12DRAFT_293472 [Pisolithus orientalis]KAI6030462.1 hypothetical protein F5J12DRAFT_293472 [Pisolithus orientalis]